MSELILTSIPKEDLIAEISAIIIANLKEELKAIKAEPEDSKLTPAEACELLKLSIPTLKKWTKAGIISRQTIGRRVYYLKSELLAAGTKSKK